MAKKSAVRIINFVSGFVLRFLLDFIASYDRRLVALVVSVSILSERSSPKVRVFLSSKGRCYKINVGKVCPYTFTSAAPDTYSLSPYHTGPAQPLAITQSTPSKKRRLLKTRGSIKNSSRLIIENVLSGECTKG